MLLAAAWRPAKSLPAHACRRGRCTSTAGAGHRRTGCMRECRRERATSWRAQSPAQCERSVNHGRDFVAPHPHAPDRGDGGVGHVRRAQQPQPPAGRRRRRVEAAAGRGALRGRRAAARVHKAARGVRSTHAGPSHAAPPCSALQPCRGHAVSPWRDLDALTSICAGPWWRVLRGAGVG